MDPQSAQRIPAEARRRPGRMTAVMQAMSLDVSAARRVLRVGIVRAGRVIDERIVKQRITVTIGTREDAMFVVPSAPPSFALFQREGADYVLHLLDGMTARLALPTGITELRGGLGTSVLLTDEARGKIVIGDTTILFQLVAPLPVQPKAQLPLGVKSGLTGKNDWTLTFIAAFSFLFHFGLVGGMYSDWSDPIVGDSHDVAGLVDMIGKITPPPIIEIPDQPIANVPSKVPTLPTKQPVSAPQETTPRHLTTSTPRPFGTISTERAASLANQAEAMQMQILAGMNGGPSVAGAIDRSNVPPIDLGSAAERNVGVVNGGNDLRPTSGGPVQARPSSGLSALGDAHARSNNGPGKETAVAGPTGITQIGTPVTSVPVPGADGTVATLRTRFRRCYEIGLLTDSTMSGKVVIRASVGPNGEVASSDIASITGLSPSVGQCIAAVVKRATFERPGGTGATIQIPVSFVQQAK